jgi:hypothetical protein
MPYQRFAEGAGRDALRMREKQRGPQLRAPFYLRRTLLISLLLVEPIFRSGQVFRPVVEVEIPAPGIICRLVLIRACPGEVSAGLPGLPILLAHSAPPQYAWTPHHAAPSHEMPGWGTRIRAPRERMASRGPSRVLASQPAVIMAFGDDFRGGVGHPESYSKLTLGGPAGRNRGSIRREWCPWP